MVWLGRHALWSVIGRCCLPLIMVMVVAVVVAAGGAGEDLENINQLWFLSLTFIGVNPLGMMFGYIRTCSMLWHGHILTLHTAYGQSAG